LMALPSGDAYARGAGIAVVTMGSIPLMWSEIAGERAWWKARAAGRFRILAISVVIAASVAAIMYVPSFASMFSIEPIGARDWIAVATVIVLATGWRAPGVRPKEKDATVRQGPKVSELDKTR
ncbi:MAG TPA: hypothetical protein VEF03_05965, partial [Candidatus Binataceae bacterium]|nr:hypothetical protein [Candidatus Binataceae bacterium]